MRKAFGGTTTRAAAGDAGCSSSRQKEVAFTKDKREGAAGKSKREKCERKRQASESVCEVNLLAALAHSLARSLFSIR